MPDSLAWSWPGPSRARSDSSDFGLPLRARVVIPQLIWQPATRYQLSAIEDRHPGPDLHILYFSVIHPRETEFLTFLTLLTTRARTPSQGTVFCPIPSFFNTVFLEEGGNYSRGTNRNILVTHDSLCNDSNSDCSLYSGSFLQKVTKVQKVTIPGSLVRGSRVSFTPPSLRAGGPE